MQSSSPILRGALRCAVVAACWVSLDLGRAAAEPTLTGPALSYVVKPGDTLSVLAQQLGTPTSEILRLNPGLEPDRIRVGQELRLQEDGRRVEHVVAPGERLLQIAAHYEVSLRALRDANPKLDPDRIRVGQKIVVYTKLPESRSESMGSPSDGALRFATRLPSNDAYVLRDPQRAWGTRETVQHIVDAFRALRRDDPDAPRVRVHDLSLREGGRMDGHRSHQSGRDVDITYYQKGCAGACAMRRVTPSDLDVERQWQLLQYWLTRGQVEAVFVDYALQAKLYAHARAEGATRAELLQWFQYPRGRTAPAGIVRHVPNHADHMHVRFVCHETDEACQMFRVHSVQASADAR